MEDHQDKKYPNKKMVDGHLIILKWMQRQMSIENSVKDKT